MKRFVSLTLVFCMFLAAPAALAQKKKAQKQPPRTIQQEQPKPEMIDIVTRIARGAHMESQDAKNVSFTLKPTCAFITIQF